LNASPSNPIVFPFKSFKRSCSGVRVHVAGSGLLRHAAAKRELLNERREEETGEGREAGSAGCCPQAECMACHGF
jgi:hypothetical protein